MNFQSEYLTPVVISLLLHAFLGVLLFVSWNQQSQLKPVPNYIRAVAIEKPKIDQAQLEKAREEALKKKRQALEQEAKKKQQALLEAQRKKEQQAIALKKKLEEEKRQKEEQQRKERERLEKERKEKERQEKERQEKLRREKEEALRKQEQLEEAERLRQFEERERLEQQGVADQSEIDQYRATITQLFKRNWTRPPSARRGMSTLLKIRLIPGGEVVNVTVVKSSGNSAFDQSAVAAVYRAKIVPVPSDQRLFNQYFREMDLNFSPEDLLQ